MARKSKSKAEVRTVIVNKSDNSYQEALAEVKKSSGFSAALPIRAGVVGAAIEYEFLVSDDIKNCEEELFTMRVEAELGNR